MPGMAAAVPRSGVSLPLTDPTSDLTFRPPSPSRSLRDDDSWEALVREELRKLRRNSPASMRVVPAARRRSSQSSGAGESEPS
jgi:hypothetical protein